MNADSLIVNAALVGLFLPIFSIPLMLLAALIQSMPAIRALQFTVAAILIGTGVLVALLRLLGPFVLVALDYMPVLGIVANGALAWLIWKSARSRNARIALAGAHLISVMLIGAFCIYFKTIQVFTGSPWH